MKLSDQVCSLDLAKRLKELGVKQDSLFYWFECPVKNEWIIGNPNRDWENYSAFTVAELGKLLPDEFYSYRLSNKWRTNKIMSMHVTIDITEANSRALMLIDLFTYDLINNEVICGKYYVSPRA